MVSLTGSKVPFQIVQLLLLGPDVILQGVDQGGLGLEKLLQVGECREHFAVNPPGAKNQQNRLDQHGNVHFVHLEQVQ